ncbi:MAG: hypothetical protein M1821_007551 [Bathelium mastoideum]|nr:MAG: hypothetical protein M1821_007551 [Bathelium mastoideum]KAI9695054.1 MAG: hypothetical protein M1822_000671 [Bathelium mastoideum]
MNWTIAIPVAIIVTVWLLARRLIDVPYDVKEPPRIPQTIPFIGHVIGMVRDGSSYYSKISAKHKLPIYTLPVPRGKIYVVNSPSLVSAVDRQSKSISFAPYVVQFAKRILVPSKEGVDALAENLQEDEGTACLRHDTLKAMHDSLHPGNDLEQTTKSAVDSVSRLLSSVYTISNNESLDLFAWVRRLVTRAGTDAIFGPKNPFQDPAVESGLWAIDKDFALLGLNILPDFVASKGSTGRKALFEGFRKYYAEGGQKTASRLVQARYNVNRKYDITTEDIVHFDLSVCYGALVNTVPGTSWSLYYIYSRPALLKELRDAMSVNVNTPTIPGSDPVHHVNISEVIVGCPLLASIVQETLRVQSTNASGRMVLKDTWLEDKYLLKKDSMLFIPSAELHSSSAVWGPTAAEFDPYRFLQKRPAGVKVPAAAYRAYGSGASVCPGRFLAANEIMTILVMMVLRYDLVPVKGEWKVPKSKPHITTSVLTPIEDISVTVKVREGFEGAKWRFSWDGAEGMAQPELST